MTAKAKTSPIAIAVVIAMVAGSAMAATAADTIAKRQAGFKEIGGSFKAVNDELKNDSPDTKLIAAKSKIIAAHAKSVPAWFPKGSGPESGAKTKAQPAIWTDWTKFAAAAKGFQTESAKLQTVAAAGNVDAIKAQVRAVGGSCKTCHEPFRAQ